MQAGSQGPGGQEGNGKEKTMGNTKGKLRGRQTSVKSIKKDRTGEDVQKSDPHTLQVGMKNSENYWQWQLLRMLDPSPKGKENMSTPTLTHECSQQQYS